MRTRTPVRLSIADLGPSRGVREPGVKTWELLRGERKTPERVLAWTDLALLDVRPSWPSGCLPEREPDWSGRALRVLWVPELGRWAYAPTTVPDLSVWVDLEPSAALPRVERVWGGTWEERPGVRFRLLRVGGRDVYWRRESDERITRAFGEVDLRWADPVVLAFVARRVRAVASVRSRP